MTSTAIVAVLFLCGIIIFQPARVLADEKADAQQLVDMARYTIHNFLSDPNMGAMREQLKNAKGVFIIPQLLRGAYVFGISGGSGVFLARDGNNWRGPAFYTVGGASIGLQIGGEASEVMLIVMTERGVNAFLSSTLKFGADADVAVGPIGIGIAAQSANLSGDILSFSRSKGLYGGASLQGAVVASRGDLNNSFYSMRVDNLADILIRPRVTSSKAAGLLEEVEKAARK